MPAYVPPQPDKEPRKDADREAKTEKPKNDATQKPVTYTDFASI